MEGRTKNLEKELCNLAKEIGTWGLDSRNSARLLIIMIELTRVLDKRLADIEARMGD